MEALGLLMHGFAVLLTWKTLLLMMLGGGVTLAAALLIIALGLPWPIECLAFTMLGLGFYSLHGVIQIYSTELAPQSRGLAMSLHSSFFFLGQAQMTFIGQQFVGTVDAKVIALPVEGLRKPKLGGEILRMLILYHTPDPGRDLVVRAFVGYDDHFDLRAVGKLLFIDIFIEINLPYPEFIAFHGVVEALPVVEVAGQVQGMRLGCPFAVDPGLDKGIILKAKVIRATAELTQAAEVLFDEGAFVEVTLVSCLNFAFAGLEPGVLGDQS